MCNRERLSISKQLSWDSRDDRVQYIDLLCGKSETTANSSHQLIPSVQITHHVCKENCAEAQPALLRARPVIRAAVMICASSTFHSGVICLIKRRMYVPAAQSRTTAANTTHIIPPTKRIKRAVRSCQNPEKTFTLPKSKRLGWTSCSRHWYLMGSR